MFPAVAAPLIAGSSGRAAIPPTSVSPAKDGDRRCEWSPSASPPPSPGGSPLPNAPTILRQAAARPERPDGRSALSPQVVWRMPRAADGSDSWIRRRSRGDTTSLRRGRPAPVWLNIGIQPVGVRCSLALADGKIVIASAAGPGGTGGRNSELQLRAADDDRPTGEHFGMRAGKPSHLHDQRRRWRHAHCFRSCRSHHVQMLGRDRLGGLIHEYAQVA
jgi:hypothetical protein